jgi:hypothetical protein
LAAGGEPSRRAPADDHDELRASVAAHALAATEETDDATARAHIESCPSCRELARRLARAVAAVPLSVDEVEPPERLRARILARCHRARRGT